MLNKNILAISAITASLLIWCGGGSSSSSDVNATETNTSQETVTDNPTIISNLKVTPIVVSTRSVQASSDFAISYTVEDKDGLVNSAVHVKGEDGIEIKTQTFTFQDTQTKENVSATFNISEIGNYSVEVEAKGVGSSSNSSKKSDATFEVTSKDEPTPASDTTAPVLSSSDKTFTTVVGTSLDLVDVSATDDTDGSVDVSKSGEVDFNTAGTYKVVYTATDSSGNSASITHTYVVNEATSTNTAPKANDDTVTTAHNTSVTIDVLANDTDTNGDTLSITTATSDDGDCEIVDSKIKFTPTSGFSWDTTIAYTISDGKGGTDTASVSVEVEALNTKPTLLKLTADWQLLISNQLTNLGLDIADDDLSKVTWALSYTHPAQSWSFSQSSGTGNTLKNITFTADPGFATWWTITATVTDTWSNTTQTSILYKN